MRTRALLVATLLVAGCSSSASSGWTKDGMTKEQLGNDTLQCLNEAREIMPAGRQGPASRIDQTVYQRCMSERGYTAASK